MKHAPRILVVDDQPINVRLLERKLERSGMEVHAAFEGPEAIEKAQSLQPNVILLDIMMPGMDGFDVCRTLKERPETRDIPIIFITAKTTKEGKLTGLNCGAADYITKPIDLDETVARIQTQLRIQESHRDNLELTERLADMRRQAAIAHMTEGIAHNLNNVMGVLVGYVELLRMGLSDPKRVENCCEQLEKAVERVVNIVKQLTRVAAFEKVSRKPCRLEELIPAALDRFRQEYEIMDPIEVDDPVGEFEFLTNQEMLEDMIGRLLINAWESYRSNAPETRPIRLMTNVQTTDTSRQLILAVEDDGDGIPENIRDNIFDPFVSSETAVGRGMGLTIVRHAVKSLGGEVRVTDREEGGTRVTVYLPLEPLPKPQAVPDVNDDESDETPEQSGSSAV